MTTVLAGVTADPPNESSQGSLEPQEYNKSTKIKYVPINIWMKKKDSQKWLVAQMGVMEGSVVLLTLCFRGGEPRLSWEWQTYVGPDVNSLPIEVTDVIDYLMKTVGLSTKMIMNMAIYSSSRSDEMDYRWLVDLKQTMT